MAVGGVHIGDTVEEMEKACQKRGFGLPKGKNRISWADNWTLIWGNMDGKISLLALSNEKLIKKAESHRDVGSAAPVGVSKGGTK